MPTPGIKCAYDSEWNGDHEGIMLIETENRAIFPFVKDLIENIHSWIETKPDADDSILDQKEDILRSYLSFIREVCNIPIPETAILSNKAKFIASVGILKGSLERTQLLVKNAYEYMNTKYEKQIERRFRYMMFIESGIGKQINDKLNDEYDDEYIPSWFFKLYEKNRVQIREMCEIDTRMYTEEGDMEITLCECLKCGCRFRKFENDNVSYGCDHECNLILYFLNGKRSIYKTEGTSESPSDGKRDLQILNNNLKKIRDMEITPDQVFKDITSEWVKEKIFKSHYSSAWSYAKRVYIEKFRKGIEDIDASNSDKAKIAYDRYNTIANGFSDELKKEINCAHLLKAKADEITSLVQLAKFKSELKPYSHLTENDDLEELVRLLTEFDDHDEVLRSRCTDYRQGLYTQLMNVAETVALDLTEISSTVDCADPNFNSIKTELLGNYEVLKSNRYCTEFVVKYRLDDAVKRLKQREHLASVIKSIHDCKEAVDSEGEATNIERILNVIAIVESLSDDEKIELERSDAIEEYGSLKDINDEYFLKPTETILNREVNCLKDIEILLYDYNSKLDSEQKKVLSRAKTDGVSRYQEFNSRLESCMKEILDNYKSSLNAGGLDDERLEEIRDDFDIKDQELDTKIKSHDSYADIEILLKSNLENNKRARFNDIETLLSALENEAAKPDDATVLRNTEDCLLAIKSRYESLSDEHKGELSKAGILSRYRDAEFAVAKKLINRLNTYGDTIPPYSEIKEIRRVCEALGDKPNTIRYLMAHDFYNRLSQYEQESMHHDYADDVESAYAEIMLIDTEKKDAFEELLELKRKYEKADPDLIEAYRQNGIPVLLSCMISKAKTAAINKEILGIASSIETLAETGITPENFSEYCEVKDAVNELDNQKKNAFFTFAGGEIYKKYNALRESETAYKITLDCENLRRELDNIPEEMVELEHIYAIKNSLEKMSEDNPENPTVIALSKDLDHKVRNITTEDQYGIRYRELSRRYSELHSKVDVDASDLDEATDLIEKLKTADNTTREYANTSMDGERPLSDKIEELPKFIEWKITLKKFRETSAKAEVLLDRKDNNIANFDEYFDLAEDFESLLDANFENSDYDKDEKTIINAVKNLEEQAERIRSRAKLMKETKAWHRQAKMFNVVNKDNVRAVEVLLRAQTYDTEEIVNTKDELRNKFNTYVHSEEDAFVRDLNRDLNNARLNNEIVYDVYLRYYSRYATLSDYCRENLDRSKFKESLTEIMGLQTEKDMASLQRALNAFKHTHDIDAIDDINKMFDGLNTAKSRYVIENRIRADFEKDVKIAYEQYARGIYSDFKREISKRKPSVERIETMRMNLDNIPKEYTNEGIIDSIIREMNEYEEEK